MAIDIAVIGGGFAGLCAAMHSLRLRPGTRVTVIDARPLPGDPDRRGVGESTSELAAWYLSSRLGLRSTLESEQIVKFGLRFWLAEPGGPRAIDDRIEWGPMGWPTGMQRFCELPLEPHAYQLHRGRLEHTLAERIAEAGAELLGEHRVVAVRPVGDTFELEVEGPLGRRCLRTRWVIDASGDGVPSRQLGVTDDHRLDHGLAASWWWVEGRVDPSSWATDPRVGARSTPDLRMRSTHHFIGDGTWAWLIPLVDGSTSVGLVVDTGAHPALATMPSARLGTHMRDWLGELEPQLAEHLTELPSSRVHAGRPASRACRRPLGTRWLVTGSALAFLDPLYSSGHDLTALLHELAVPAIIADLEGRDILSTIERTNQTVSKIIEHFAAIYEGSYAVLHDPVVGSLKLGWDQMIYFGWLCTIGLAGSFSDADLMHASTALADRVHRLNDRVQRLLRRWAAARRASGQPSPGRGFVDQGAIATIMEHFIPLARIASGELDRAAVLATLHSNIERLEQAALGILERMCIDRQQSFPREPLDPYGIGFDPARWAADGLFRARRSRRLTPEVQRDMAVLALEGNP